MQTGVEALPASAAFMYRSTPSVSPAPSSRSRTAPTIPTLFVTGRDWEYALFDIDPQRLDESYKMRSIINRNCNEGKAKIVKYLDRVAARRGTPS